MLSLQQVNEMYMDVLKEIGNIGAGNATTAIADMLGLRIDMNVPEVQFLPVEKIGTSIGAEDDVIVGIMLGVETDINGSFRDQRGRQYHCGILSVRVVRTDQPYHHADRPVCCHRYGGGDPERAGDPVRHDGG